jgi:Putative auto-transporter adhesin, head GIN domain
MKPKIYLSIITLIFSTSILLAQKAEKIKGSKVVTTSQKEIKSFNAIEIGDNLEVNLEKGDKNEIKIEADDNLHDIINLEVQDDILMISTSKEAQGFKKLSVKITYTNNLNLVTTKDESVVNAIQEIILDNITFKTFDKSKLFLNVNSKNFILQSNDKSKIELNLKGENSFIELSKNATLKALINSVDLKCDLYQKANAVIEGDATNANLRLDNSAELNARNFNIKNGNLAIEGNANCSILAENSIAISATDRAEIALFGTPKIEINKLEGEAKLLKKLSSKK